MSWRGKEEGAEERRKQSEVRNLSSNTWTEGWIKMALRKKRVVAVGVR